MGCTQARGIGSAKAAVGMLHRKELATAPDGEREAPHTRLVAKHERTAGGVDRATAIGVVDEIIDPAAACPKHWPPPPPDAAPTPTSRSDTRRGRRVAALFLVAEPEDFGGLL